jgi:hypothetical protein
LSVSRSDRTQQGGRTAQHDRVAHRRSSPDVDYACVVFALASAAS